MLSCTRSSIRLLLEFSKCGGAAARCNETKFHKGCILQFLTIAKERYISHWVGESCAIKRDKTSRAGIPGLKQRSGTLNLFSGKTIEFLLISDFPGQENYFFHSDSKYILLAAGLNTYYLPAIDIRVEIGDYKGIKKVHRGHQYQYHLPD